MLPPPPDIFKGDYFMNLDIEVNGPLARSPEDLDLAMDVIVSPGPADRKAWKIELPGPRKKSLKNYKIGLWIDDQACPVDSDVAGCIQNAADTLSKAGVHIEEKRPDIDFSRALELFSTLVNGAICLGIPQKNYDKWILNEADFSIGDNSFKTKSVRGSIQRLRNWHFADFERQLMRQKWADYFTDFDALLCPAAVTAAFPHDQSSWFERTISVNKEIRPYSDIMGWAGLTNIAYLPSTVAPAGFTQDGDLLEYK